MRERDSRSRGLAVIPQDVVPVKTEPSARFPGPSRAKDGAISPRLGNRSGRFPLSDGSCDDGIHVPSKREQLLEGSQPAPNGVGTWEKMYQYFQFRRDEFLQHYHKRSNVESAFSTMKRKFGDGLRSKTDVAMVNET